MQTLIVESVEQLTKAVRQIFESTGSRWWFRGQRNEKWPLLPGVKRGYSRQQE